ncbi:hypothetical protein FISHEDRAFT_51488 [Fistulina hepatica ATCC 64428]|uniref:IPT/TIG domain-containing protein n=1 Tax=Fistulina hepatica ATCC 64428 TaxID=1128425 RepID=A0A0D7A069_9AGAR|nr:hypothetical protein FISHEDRAFT_51488 [Fistulina hepatica ATCC 64428]
MFSPSSSTTATDSRSPSPHTPASADSASDSWNCRTPPALQTPVHEHATWFSPVKTMDPESTWEITTNDSFLKPAKQEVPETQILLLDDLIDNTAYDDFPTDSQVCSVPQHATHVDPAPEPRGQALASSPSTPIAPPHSTPEFRIRTSSPVIRSFAPSFLEHKTVYPPKESCFNLPILFPTIPPTGTKSRVETQIRVTVDLADSVPTHGQRCSRVGSWKWLCMPEGTSTKKRSRKHGKIDAQPQEILYLHSTARRVAKKIAARVRPQQSDSDDDGNLRKDKHEDTTSIVHFNCPDMLEFSTGSAVLPIRITCYCRHHREKVGFRLNFTMVDHVGRIVGAGTSPPIMITDDHKTANTTSNRHGDAFNGYPNNNDSDWVNTGVSNVGVPKPKKPLKRRPKPYDAASSSRPSREGSTSSAPTPSSSAAAPSAPDTPSPPSSTIQQIIASNPPPSPPSNVVPQLAHSSLESGSSSETLITPFDSTTDITMLDFSSQFLGSDIALPPASIETIVSPTQSQTTSLPFLFLDYSQPQPTPTQLPTIHRLIPNSGPTHGGIEVTILGANFPPSTTLNCVFGDVVASSTQRWSDNTLVCVLPPRVTPGVVAVWFDGFKRDDIPADPNTFFTYTDESDRALMELALQVVGLKMTGKIEDAKNVAMRIVGSTGDGSDPQGGGRSNTSQGVMHMTAHMAASTRDLRPFLLRRTGEGEDFESVIINFLSIVDTPVVSPHVICTSEALSCSTSSGQTLLHLASFLGFSRLVAFLLQRSVDTDARDRNGCTALHLTALVGSLACARALVAAGADMEIVNARGKTPIEIAVEGFFDDISMPDGFSQGRRRCPSTSPGSQLDEDEEARWGDVEDDGDDGPPLASAVRRAGRRTATRRRHGARHQSAPESDSSASFPESKEQSSKNSEINASEKGTLPSLADVPIGNEKQAESFIAMLQKSLAMMMGPNIVQLPRPYIPQLTTVLPAYVPLPAFLTGEREGFTDGQPVADMKGVGAGAIRAAQELRTTLEKFMALVGTHAHPPHDEPPPEYTPSASGNVAPANAAVAAGSRSAAKRPEYTGLPVTEQEVKAYGFRPQQPQQFQKKHDRMLILFWLPILFMSIIWAIINGIQFVFEIVKTTVPMRSWIGGL